MAGATLGKFTFAAGIAIIGILETAYSGYRIRRPTGGIGYPSLGRDFYPHCLPCPPNANPADTGDQVRRHYRSLLQEARASGLQDQRLLLGLMACPFGTISARIEQSGVVQGPIKENDQDEILDPRQMQVN